MKLRFTPVHADQIGAQAAIALIAVFDGRRKKRVLVKVIGE
jgi:hypothetical protein